jgi:nucleoside-diphosphate-sugar epimerase
MSILITGASGFLGTHLAQTLFANGEKIVGVDVLAPASSRPWPVLIGDVKDNAFIQRLFNDHDIHSVIHCGGISGPHVCNKDPARVFEVNVLGTLNLFENARKHKLKGRLIFISSSSVYGQPSETESCKRPINENAPLLANEPYGCSKVACESMLRAYVNQENLDMISLRVSIVYGPERTTYCGITQMIKAALVGAPIVLAQGADLPLPWIHIDDLTEAILAAMHVRRTAIREVETLAYNVTGPGYPTFREIATVIKELMPGTVIMDNDNPDAYAMNARKMSISAIERDFGWKPKIFIDKGVHSLYVALTGKNLIC